MADTSWAASLPTPARLAQKRPLAEAPEPVGGEYSRNVRPRAAGYSVQAEKAGVAEMDSATPSKAPMPKPAALFILDGLNILKSRNNPTWGSGGPGGQDLEWDQLEKA